MLGARLRRRLEGDGGADTGAALVVVIILAAVMLVVVASALTGATSGLRQATTAQGTARALDAAYAGVQDYIAKLNADSSYPQYGNPAAPFSSAATVKLPTTTNAAFGVGASGSWADVTGSQSASSFRYEVDNSLYGSSGLLRVRATGRSGAFTKTLVASIQQQGFINYLYFTNYEVQDPRITGTSANCDTYLWSSPARDADACGTIQFAPKDVIAGPVRSNDTLTVCGTTFKGSVTTSNPNTPVTNTPYGCSGGTYASAPAFAPVLTIPATNTSMKAQTYSDKTATPGCLYTGPTQITLNADGTMTVVSPWTEFTNVRSDQTSGSNPTACGALADLHSTRGATVPVPANNLVFVQDVPTSTTNVNATPISATTTSTSTTACTVNQGLAGSCTTTTGAACTTALYLANKCFYTTTTTSSTAGGAVPSGVTQATWPAGASYTCTGASGTAQSTATSSGSAGWILRDGNGTLQYPLVNESPASNWSSGSGWDTTTPAYGCRSGDAFVSGTISGKLTIASDNYVYATGDVLYKDPSSDVLGLVGNNGVLVWNPMNQGTPMLGMNREIDAAILSPAHTFQVQNWDVGPDRGVLTVKGSIAQNYRGTVGRGNAGYAKAYQYDPRFATVTPPYYLKPTSASFKVASYASTAPAFTSAGAVR